MADIIKNQMDIDEYYKAVEEMQQTAQQVSPYEVEEPEAMVFVELTAADRKADR